MKKFFIVKNFDEITLNGKLVLLNESGEEKAFLTYEECIEFAQNNNIKNFDIYVEENCPNCGCKVEYMVGDVYFDKIGESPRNKLRCVFRKRRY